MERKIILSVLAAAVFGFIAIMLFPGREADPHPKLPWDISIDEAGRLTVFTLTLGTSTLADARTLLDEEGEINLFVRNGEEYVVEAYFQHIYLSGLLADFVMTIAVPAADAKAMYDRGLRISQLSSGSKKIKMTPEDISSIAQAPIRHITYLPAANLDEDLVEGRFGKPQEKYAEESGVVHWLYPDRGLDVGREPDGGIVIQYVSPGSFDDVLEPLRSTSS